MRRKDSLFDRLVEIVNTRDTIVTKDVYELLDQYCTDSWLGRHYRLASYLSYMRHAGILKTVKRGESKVMMQIPLWLTLTDLEVVHGHKKGNAEHVLVRLQESQISVGDTVRYAHPEYAKRIGFHKYAKEDKVTADGTYKVTQLDEGFVKVKDGGMWLPVAAFEKAKPSTAIPEETQTTITKFKKGDRVRCTTYNSEIYPDAKHYMKKDGVVIGRTYVVREVTSNIKLIDKFVYLEDTRDGLCHAMDCFELVTEKEVTPVTPESKFKRGDRVRTVRTTSGKGIYFGNNPSKARHNNCDFTDVKGLAGIERSVNEMKYSTNCKEWYYKLGGAWYAEHALQLQQKETKKQNTDTVMKNQQPFHVSGTPSLVKAFTEELKAMGYKVCSIDSDVTYTAVSTNMFSGNCKSIEDYKEVYVDHKVHAANPSKFEARFSLPTQWDAAMKFCKDAIDPKNWTAKTKTLTMSSKNISVKIGNGSIEVLGNKYDIKDVKATVHAFFNKQVQMGTYSVTIPTDMQCIRIGCAGEDVRFSIDELQTIVNEYNKING